MFSMKIIPAETWAHYSYNSGALHIHYDKSDEFSASLAILADNYDSKKTESGVFNSLVFTFNNKITNSNTILMSIMKIDNNTILFNVSNNKDKFLSHKIGGISEIITKIALETQVIFISRLTSDPYFTNTMLIAQSKKLLAHFNCLAKGILDASEPVKSSTKALEKISNLLNMEIAEFNNVIELNKESHPSPRSP